MLQSPETIAKVREWREKTANGTITLDEMKQAILHLRGERRAGLEASQASGKPKSTKQPARSADDMLADFES